jgi:hypothetical protein
MTRRRRQEVLVLLPHFHLCFAALMIAVVLCSSSVSALSQGTTGQPPTSPPTTGAVPDKTVPAEMADCAGMPTESQKAECLRQHPYTGRILLPHEKEKSTPPAKEDAEPKK